MVQLFIPAGVDLFLTTFFVLTFGHFLADFPLQGQYMSEHKCPERNSAQVWPLIMSGHCMIHAGTVFLITGSLILAAMQFVAHFVIDWHKCKGLLGEGDKAFFVDQIFHSGVLAAIALIYTLADLA